VTLAHAEHFRELTHIQQGSALGWAGGIRGINLRFPTHRATPGREVGRYAALHGARCLRPSIESMSGESESGARRRGNFFLPERNSLRSKDLRHSHWVAVGAFDAVCGRHLRHFAARLRAAGCNVLWAAQPYPSRSKKMWCANRARRAIASREAQAARKALLPNGAAKAAKG
jgi:hypothetical protein